MKPVKRSIHTLCILALILLPCLSAWSQSRDSLWIVWTDDSKTTQSRFSFIETKILRSGASNIYNADSLIILGQQIQRKANRLKLPKYESFGLFVQARGYSFTNDIDNAINYYYSAIEIAQDHDYKELLGLCYRHLSNMLIQRGEFSQALELLHTALDFYLDKNNKRGLAFCYDNLGLVYHFLDEHYMAQENYNKSLRLYQELDNHYMVNVVQMRIAAEYIGEGNYLESLESFSGLLNYFRRIGDTAFFALTCENYSWLLKDLGYYETAYKYLEESLNFYVASENKALIGRVKGNMGVLHHKMKNEDNALEYLNESLRIAYEIKDSNQIAIGHYNLGEFFQEQHQYYESLIQYKKSLNTVKLLGRRSDLPGLYMDLGELNIDLKDYKTAATYYDSSYRIYKRNKDSLGLAQISISIGELNLKQEKYNAAILWCTNGYNTAAHLKRILPEKDGCDCLYKSYKAIGSDDLALAYFEKRTVLQDSISSKEINKELQFLEFEYSHSSDSLSLAKENLTKELAFQKKLNREKNTRNIIMFAGITILFLTVALYSRIVYMRRTNKELKLKNRQIEEEKLKVEESEKAKETFFNNVSHEFRTPLTLILGPLEDAVESHSDSVLIPNIDMMHRNAQQMKFMIDELLELSKIEFGNVKLKVKEENIVKLTEDHLHSFESLATRKEISLRFRSELSDYKVWVDEEKFRKIITNILSNAFKFTPPRGKITVEVSGIKTYWESPENSDFHNHRKGIKIEVTDNGIGIPDEKLPYIFDRFYQAGGPAQSQHAGSGIGLALTKELVELHHGSISVDSSPVKGTRFTIFIPFGTWHLNDPKTVVEIETADFETKQNSDSGTWEIEKQITATQNTGNSIQKEELPIVLVVEDNPDMRFYIKNHLEREFNILEAIDGKEGFKAAVEQIPDLIISDRMMPNMSGCELIKKLRSDERTGHIPIIILTAMASVDDKIDGLESGADAYVTKPFNTKELTTRVRKLIEQRQKLSEKYGGKLETGRKIQTDNSAMLSIDQKFIQKAIQVVTDHISDPSFDASTFASEMALSRIQLHRKLKAISNKTTTEFIRTIRLSKAADMLKQNTGNVTEIAYDTGFSSLSWFAKTFKAQFGVARRR